MQPLYALKIILDGKKMQGRLTHAVGFLDELWTCREKLLGADEVFPMDRIPELVPQRVCFHSVNAARL